VERFYRHRREGVGPNITQLHQNDRDSIFSTTRFLLANVIAVNGYKTITGDTRSWILRPGEAIIKD
jgi:hypothetical protein